MTLIPNLTKNYEKRNRPNPHKYRQNLFKKKKKLPANQIQKNYKRDSSSWQLWFIPETKQVYLILPSLFNIVLKVLDKKNKFKRSKESKIYQWRSHLGPTFSLWEDFDYKLNFFNGHEIFRLSNFFLSKLW